MKRRRVILPIIVACVLALVVYRLAKKDAPQPVASPMEVDEHRLASAPPRQAAYLTQSPDQIRIAWAEPVANGKWGVRIYGQAGPEFDEFGGFVFSPDGSRVAYTAARGSKWIVGADSHAGAEYDWAGNLTFNPDGVHTVYTAKRSGQWFVVVNGKEGPAFDEIL